MYRVAQRGSRSQTAVSNLTITAAVAAHKGNNAGGNLAWQQQVLSGGTHGEHALHGCQSKGAEQQSVHGKDCGDRQDRPSPSQCRHCHACCAAHPRHCCYCRGEPCWQPARSSAICIASAPHILRHPMIGCTKAAVRSNLLNLVVQTNRRLERGQSVYEISPFGEANTLPFATATAT